MRNMHHSLIDMREREREREREPQADAQDEKGVLYQPPSVLGGGGFDDIVALHDGRKLSCGLA